MICLLAVAVESDVDFESSGQPVPRIDRPATRVDAGFDDGEAEAGAAGVAGAGGVEAVEGVEDFGEFVGGDAGALVGDDDGDSAPAVAFSFACGSGGTKCGYGVAGFACFHRGMGSSYSSLVR